MWDWIGKLDELKRQGRKAVLVTVIRYSGSTPRKTGAKMIVLADGNFFGTVGGGVVEHHALEEATRRLQSGESGTMEISLKQSEGSDFPACGGTVELYMEVLNAEPNVFIFGAGHVGQALYRVLQGTPFRIHLIDDRPEWIGSPEIPDGIVRHSCRWSQFISEADWCERRSFVVIVSFSGAVDQEILREVLSHPARYVGMIGSRAKWGKVKGNLEEEGLDLSRVRCPIGHDNGGGAPQEIAIAIASQLLSVHYGGSEVKDLRDLKVVIRGAGEMATGVAWRLYRAGFRRTLMLEKPAPLAVRRAVCFCEALRHTTMTVQGVEAVSASTKWDIGQAWHREKIPVLVDPVARLLCRFRWDIFIDAALAKTNLGTALDDAPLVIGLGPGFTAGTDCHAVIETNRGHDLGRVIVSGSAQADTGVPAEIGGYGIERVLRSSASGRFKSARRIGDRIAAGDLVGRVGDADVVALISGVLRGLIMPGTQVTQGMKVGDIDPRGDAAACHTISDKANAIGGGVVEAILSAYNR